MSFIKKFSDAIRNTIKWRDLLFLGFGCIFATISNNWSYFTFNPEIGITDLFTSLIGAWVGFYVGSQLASKVSSERAEKDLMMEQLHLIRNDLNKLESFLETGTIPLNQATPIFKSSSQKLLLIQSLLKACKRDQTLILSATNIFTKFRTLNSKVTSSTSPNGILSFDPPMLLILDAEAKGISDAIILLIIQINRD